MAVGTTRDGAIFIGGEFRPASGGATQPVLEKATGEPLADVGVATVEDLDLAVSAAASCSSFAAPPTSYWALPRIEPVSRTIRSAISSPRACRAEAAARRIAARSS